MSGGVAGRGVVTKSVICKSGAGVAGSGVDMLSICNVCVVAFCQNKRSKFSSRFSANKYHIYIYCRLIFIFVFSLLY